MAARGHRRARATRWSGSTGDLDLVTAPELLAAIEPNLDAGTGALVVDLSRLAFIDSSGLSALIRVNRRMSAAGRELSIIAPASPAAKAFEITGLDQVLPPARRAGLSRARARPAGRPALAKYLGRMDASTPDATPTPRWTGPTGAAHRSGADARRPVRPAAPARRSAPGPGCEPDGPARHPVGPPARPDRPAGRRSPGRPAREPAGRHRVRGRVVGVRRHRRRCGTPPARTPNCPRRGCGRR